MKRLTSFLLLAFLGVGTAAWAGATPDQPNPLTDLSSQSITSLASDDVAAQLGRKLRPVERRQLRRARRLHKRHPEWSTQQAFDAVKPMNRWALIGLVSSIISSLSLIILRLWALSYSSLTLTLLFPLVGATFGAIGIIASVIAIRQITTNEDEQRGWSAAHIGLNLSLVVLLMSLISI